MYWTNRAICYKNLGKWEQVEINATMALFLEKDFFKARYILSLALIELEKSDRAVTLLEKLYQEAEHENDGQKVREIWSQLARARFSKWKADNLQRNIKLVILKEKCLEALKARVALKENEHLEENVQDILAEDATLTETELTEVFAKASETPMIGAVPEYLKCSITQAIFHDPVIAPSGYSFEKYAILKHLSRDNTNPMISPSQLVPNRALKDAALDFLEKSGEAVTLLEKLYQEAKHENDGEMSREIWSQLARARFSKLKADNLQRDIKLVMLKEKCLEALKASEALEDNEHLEGNEGVERYVQNILAEDATLTETELTEVFAKASETPMVVPEYLKCSITQAIFHDPVIAPSGHSFEKYAILKHLSGNNFNPMTRGTLAPSQLVPNRALKDAALAFLEKHHWAYAHC